VVVGVQALLLAATAWHDDGAVFVDCVVVLFVVFLHNLVAMRGGRIIRALVCGALLAAGVIGGAARYEETLKWDNAWPQWVTEVGTWEHDPAHKLALWPPGWTVELHRRRP
jgi:hypothetical protein